MVSAAQHIELEDHIEDDKRTRNESQILKQCLVALASFHYRRAGPKNG
ncbi:MAG: hypothetical protein HW376_426 [candidate division NC10 bacterium]|nr:hypothetical protein [candidate division NC10 bacterium]